MTVERDTGFGESPVSDGGTDALWAVTGRAVNLPFIRSALRRQYRAWVGCALVGLALGAGYHAVVPIEYPAAATLYLAHAPGSDNTVVAQNDLAMLDTAAVGDRALAILGIKGVTPTKFLGKEPGTSLSDDVLAISMSGSSPTVAVRRVDAVARAYLEFRAQQYRAQNRAVVDAVQQQANELRTRIKALSAEIAGPTGTTGGQVRTLVAERADATSELTTLQQTIRQDDLDTLSVISGSRIITPGTAAAVSMKRVFGLDGVMGLAGGLGLGLFLVIAQASLSDRIRRREDLAAVLRAPVVVSVGHVERRRFGLLRRSVLDLADGRDRGVAVLSQYFQDLSVTSGGAPVMVVAADDCLAPGAAVFAAARKLAEDDRRIILVDATDGRVVASALGKARGGDQPVLQGIVTFFAPPMPWEGTDGGISKVDPDVVRRADAVFVIASIEVATGAWHLREWSSHSVVTVSSGTSTVQKIAAFVELLDAAGIVVKAGVLLESDPLDDSPGLPVPGFPAPGMRLGIVRTAPSEAP